MSCSIPTPKMVQLFVTPITNAANTNTTATATAAAGYTELNIIARYRDSYNSTVVLIAHRCLQIVVCLYWAKTQKLVHL
jgi:hypothetical protein